ncbi:AAA family ATPase [Sphingobacterium sp. UGAL515B_05]|uniref:AAA family ATPase n=1 Tax=Sphingobacterium sp. UGAL515B_05 TaxID=2986767 RepID=UPI0029539BA7|nr:AAA family ATPase [Sphingobacterium sp. UGAL515B_05]WON93747.1 AAA family ATPase [Sphingobacterium sp. UGAL515B_05]
MLLYIWVNEYKHIKKTGFNLSSLYEFSFIIKKDSHKTNEIVGRLECVKKRTPKLFNDQIIDVKAIIGENGSGKSTLLEILIQNIMTKSNFYFDGFIITDKFIFNRKGIDFGTSISEIKYFVLEEVLNVELVNYNRDEFQRKLKAYEVQDSHQGQIATSHLNHISIIHYSPLLNLDRIANIEGVAGSSRTWETDYWHYYDYTTENCIVDDYHALNIGESSYYISGESELLAHKSAESKRNLEFLSTEIFKELPFKNRIESVHIRLNDFYQRFWESIDSFLKADNDLEGKIEEVIASIKLKAPKEMDNLKELESNLYVSFLYGALKYEYKNRMDFGDRGNSNAIFSTIELFLSSTSKTKTQRSTIESFLQKAQFTDKFKSSIFSKIKKAVDFIIKSPSIINRSNYHFSIPLADPAVLKEFVKLFFDDFILEDEGDKRTFIFDIFSIEFVGLSSGEKNLLSMFSRLKRAADTIPKSQSDVVFLLDEPEVTLHPQWQISFIKLLNENLPKLFPEKILQILISSHSPILVSDLPKNNILFLEKDIVTGECKVSKLRDMQKTFGANIHSLYADAFFLKDKGGAMGEFAKGIIKDIINELNKEAPENPEHLKIIIELVGEPLIQNQLLEWFYKKFPEQRIENIDERIAFLEKELNSIKEIKMRGKNENNK